MVQVGFEKGRGACLGFSFVLFIEEGRETPNRSLFLFIFYFIIILLWLYIYIYIYIYLYIDDNNDFFSLSLSWTC